MAETRTSKRLLTQRRLAEFLSAEVTPDNGYKHDLTGRVFRGRMFASNADFADVGNKECISILENLDPDRYPARAGGEHDSPTTAEDWILLLQGWVPDDKANPTDPAYELMADVKRALAKLRQRPRPLSAEPANPWFHLPVEDGSSDALITGMAMEPGIVRPPIEQVSARAFFWMRVTLKFAEDPNDPYLL